MFWLSLRRRSLLERTIGFWIKDAVNYWFEVGSLIGIGKGTPIESGLEVIV